MNPTIIDEEVQTQQKEAHHAKIRELAKQQGVKPIRKIEDLQSDVWAENERVDEFLEWVEEVRNSEKTND